MYPFIRNKPVKLSDNSLVVFDNRVLFLGLFLLLIIFYLCVNLSDDGLYLSDNLVNLCLEFIVR